MQSLSLIFNRLTGFRVLFLFIFALGLFIPATAKDPQNCLMCHRYPGLGRVDSAGSFKSFFIDPMHEMEGPHQRVSCKDCHSDIEEIPHYNAEKVNCTKTCHIEEPNREILFSHKKVQESLDFGVHATKDKDGNDNEFIEDYPSCKDCHDSPEFKPLAIHKSLSAGVSEQAINRCMVCHEDEKFVRYSYNHVTSRLKKSRDPMEILNLCGKCHGDPEFNKRHDMPDVISSYLETYHGKAILFGSRRAPDCLDCHAGTENVHDMRGKEDEASAIYEANKPQTCSQMDCHPNAGAQLAQFRVHSTPHDSQRYPVESKVALAFVILTLSVLIPMLIISILGLLREAFPSKEAKEETLRIQKLAEKWVGKEKSRQRFSPWHRVQHALLVVSFTVLSLTGLPMKFPEAFWSSFVYKIMGGIEVAPILHRVAGVIMIIGFFLHIISILNSIGKAMEAQGKKGLGGWLSTLFGLPLMPNKDDVHDFVVMLKYIFYISPIKPAYKRFSWKEKFDYLAVFWGIPLLAVTGIIMWGEELFSAYLPGWVINISLIAHSDEALLAISFIFLIHILNVLRPFTSPLSSMITGEVTPHMLAEEHGGEVLDTQNDEEKKPEDEA